MYTKALFLMICGTYLHASLPQSSSLPSDLSAQDSHLGASHTNSPSLDDRLAQLHIAPADDQAEMCLLKSQLEALLTKQKEDLQKLKSELEKVERLAAIAKTAPPVEGLVLQVELTERLKRHQRPVRDQMQLIKSELVKVEHLAKIAETAPREG